MVISVREGEARLYWRAVSEARHIRRSAPNDQTEEQKDELEGLLIHSTWPLVRLHAQNFLAESEDRPIAHIGG